MQHLRFCLNGTWHDVRDVSPTTTVLRYVRDVLKLTGTKEGCAEGDCGACTIVVVERGTDGHPEFRAINSCLLLLPMVQGKHLFTVEALKNATTGEHHPVQVAMANALGSQCGYCTPGIVMSMFEAAHRSDLDAPWKLDDQMCGNLCRCTGYRPIRAAAQSVAGRCRNDGFAAALPAQAPQSMALSYSSGGQTFVTPTSLPDLFKALEGDKNAQLVNGGTDLSLRVTKKFETIASLISLEAIPELHELTESATGVRIGSAVTIAQLERFCETRLPPVSRMVRYFGARQIKHRGTVGGNLCTASPIGDLAPVFLSLDATAVLRSSKGERRLPLSEFFLGYRKTALLPGEILAALDVPRLTPATRAVAYKVSKRRELDISTVAAGFAVELDSTGTVVKARLAYGGMAATPKRATRTEAALVSQAWNEAAVKTAAAQLANDFSPLSDHRGSAAYRALVARNLLLGFFAETSSAAVPTLQYPHAATVQVPHE